MQINRILIKLNQLRVRYFASPCTFHNCIVLSLYMMSSSLLEQTSPKNRRECETWQAKDLRDDCYLRAEDRIASKRQFAVRQKGVCSRRATVGFTVVGQTPDANQSVNERPAQRIDLTRPSSSSSSSAFRRPAQLSLIYVTNGRPSTEYTLLQGRVQQLTGLIGLPMLYRSAVGQLSTISIHRTKWQRLSAGDTLRIDNRFRTTSVI